MLTYKKLRADTENVFRKNGKLIASTGTLIYQGKVGKEALEAICDDIPSKDINFIRRQCLGSYMLLVQEGTRMMICCDEMQTYSVYYHSGNDGILVSNNWFYIQHLIHAQVNENLLLQSIASRTIMDHNTVFEGIYKLMGSECLVYDLENDTLTVKDIGRNEYYSSNTVYTLEGLAELLVNTMSYKNQAFQDCGIAMSGGLDSRLILAANLASVEPEEKNHFALVNWTSRDESMIAFDGDTIACKEISQTMGIPLIVEDLTNEQLLSKLDKNIHSLVWRYGELAAFHNGNTRYFAFLEKKDLPQFIEYGAAGELFNTELPQQHYKSTLKDYIQWFINYTNSGVCKQVDYQKYFECAYEQWQYVAEQWGIQNIDELRQEDCDLLYNLFVYSENMDHNNLTNVFCYSFPVFAQKRIFDYCSRLPHDEKTDAHGHLALIEKMCPRLLDFEFITHRREIRIDRKRLCCITEGRKAISLKEKVKRIPFIGRMISNCAYLYHCYIPFDKKDADRKLRRELVSSCKRTAAYRDMSIRLNMNTFSEIPYIASYYTLLRIIGEDY